jgi:voltage-gated potassium channel Kch
MFTLLSVASGLIYTTEHEVNPDISNYFSALYFGLTTLTTVGFGDIVLITAEGWFVASMSILAEVSIIPAQAANLVDVIVQFQKERKKGLT